MIKKCYCCKKQFIVDDCTIHCTTCNRWYCRETSCWIDYNDENFQHSKTCKRGSNNELLGSNCDKCTYDPDGTESD